MGFKKNRPYVFKPREPSWLEVMWGDYKKRIDFMLDDLTEVGKRMLIQNPTMIGPLIDGGMRYKSAEILPRAVARLQRLLLAEMKPPRPEKIEGQLTFRFRYKRTSASC